MLTCWPKRMDGAPWFIIGKKVYLGKQRKEADGNRCGVGKGGKVMVRTN